MPIGKAVEPGTPARTIVDDELDILERVRTLAKRPVRGAADAATAADYESEMVALRDQMADERAEDLPVLVEHMTRLAALAQSRKPKAAGAVDIGSPYFAHMRIAAKEGEQPIDVLIGKRGLIDRAANVQIVDWRDAPVSQVYYRYEEGDDYEEEVSSVGAGGRETTSHLAGQVLLRRNVSIAGGRLRRIGCPQGSFVSSASGSWFELEGQGVPLLQGGQGSAIRPPRPTATRDRKRGRPRLEVSRPSRFDQKVLPEIAALIDPDQFALITAPTAGLVVIQGGAGSGKTTVALHRIAFLVFNDKSVRSNRCMVVVPSEALARYVAGVLPSLGVEGVPVVTFGAWAKNIRRRLLPNLVDSQAPETPAGVSRLKKHPLMERLLAQIVARETIDARALLERRVTALDGGAAILAAWDERGRHAPVSRARRLRSALEKGKVVVPSATVEIARLVLRDVAARLADVPRILWELLTDREMLTALRDPTVLEPATGSELDELIAWASVQMEEPLEEEHAGADEESVTPIDGRSLSDSDGSDSSARGKLDPEDDPLLLRLYQLLFGHLPRSDGEPLTYDHIAVDESQDLAVSEVALLWNLTGERRSMTIAGDVAQRVIFDNGFHGWAGLLRDVGVPEAVASVRPLRIAYRSTEPVMRFARSVLGELATDESDSDTEARPGAEVELHAFGDMGQAVGFVGDALRSLLNREPSATVALLTRHAGQANAWFAAMQRAEVPMLRRVKRQDFPFVAGVDVTEVGQVKGLEFDYVIVCDVNESSFPSTVESRHLLHIAATRATHQLWLVSTAAVPSLLREAGYRGEEEALPEDEVAKSENGQVA